MEHDCLSVDWSYLISVDWIWNSIFEGSYNYVISKYFLDEKPNTTILQDKQQQNSIMSLWTRILNFILMVFT